MVGKTDALHFAHRINLRTLAARRRQRNHHLPEARAQGATPVLGSREFAGSSEVSLPQHRRFRVFRINRVGWFAVSRDPLAGRGHVARILDEFNWDEPALDLLERLDLDHNRLTGEIS